MYDHKINDKNRHNAKSNHMLDSKTEMKKEFKIAIWNTNGLANRSLELKAFLIEQNIDLMLVSETHLTEKKFPKNS